MIVPLHTVHSRNADMAIIDAILACKNLNPSYKVVSCAQYRKSVLIGVEHDHRVERTARVYDVLGVRHFISIRPNTFRTHSFYCNCSDGALPTI